MRKTLHLFFVIVSLLIFFNCSNEKRLHTQLTEMAKNLNQSAPQQLDTFTIFMGAKVTEDNTFQYLYRIVNTNDPSFLLKESEANVKNNMKNEFNLNPDLKIFTQNKLNIDYIYADSVGTIIKTIHITPNDYK